MNRGTFNATTFDGALASGGTSPVVVQVPKGTLTITGLQPSVKEIWIPKGQVTITGLVPTVRFIQRYPIPKGTVSLTGYAPSIKYRINAEMQLQWAMGYDFEQEFGWSMAAPVTAEQEFDWAVLSSNIVQAEQQFLWAYSEEFEQEFDWSFAQALQAEQEFDWSMTTNVTTEQEMDWSVLSNNPLIVEQTFQWTLLRSGILDISGVVRIVV